MLRVRAADIAVQTLVENGVSDCFVVVGGSAMHLDDALGKNKGIAKYFTHHEQACAMAAESYARLSGKLAAVCVTSGPGATNALTGVLGAWHDSLPMIVLSGNVRHAISMQQQPDLKLRYRGLQEFDIVNSIANMTKYCVQITDATKIKSEIQKAISISLDGRRGPVWVDIPLDIQAAHVSSEELADSDWSAPEFAPSKEQINGLAKQLKQAKRPCVLIGTGVTTANMQKELEEFLESVRVPVVGGAWYGDALYNRHPRFFGLSGINGPRAGNFILYDSDLILVIANSLSYKQTGYEPERFAPKSKIIMVDVDENEPAKLNGLVNEFIQSKLKDFFAAWCSYGERVDVEDAWMSFCAKLAEKYSAYEGANGCLPNERVNKYYFWEVFNRIAPQDTIVALGNSQVCLAAGQVGKDHRDMRFVGNYVCGSMGHDLPGSVGMAIAAKRPVVLVTGDGSLMMNIQELQTIQYYKLPIKIIVFNNGGYGSIRATFDNYFGYDGCGCSPDTGVGFPDFSKLSSVFGFDYDVCPTNGVVLDKLEWALSSDTPVFLEVQEQFVDPVIPKLTTKMEENGNLITPDLFDQSPFLSQEDLESALKPYLKGVIDD
jgi:acetolactate synthase-1/2/3 large subunit